jgi:hypothetical protein
MKSPSGSETGITAMDSSGSLGPSDVMDEVTTEPEKEKEKGEALLSDTELIAQAEALVLEERLLAAARLLERVSVANHSLLMQSHLDILKSAAAFQVAIEDLLGPPPVTSSDTTSSSSSSSTTTNSDWKKQGESADSNTAIYYKVDDEARLTCRIDSPIEASLLVPLLSVLNEVNLFETWLPSWNYPKMGIQRSQRLEQKTKANQTLQITLNVPWPMATRELVMQAVAVDDIDENGWIAVRMETVESDCESGGVGSASSVVLPPESGVERIDFAGAFLFRACPADHPMLIQQQQFQQQEQPQQESLVLVSFKMHVDGHFAGVPMSLINFVTRTVIGHMWAMLLQVAKDVREGERPQHAEVIAAKPDFYGWVEQRVHIMLEQLRMQEEESSESKSVSVSPDHQQELDFVSYLQG